MADRKLVRPGTNRGEVDVDQAYFHDNSDGTYDLAEGSHLRAWDTTLLAWVKVTVDHASGNLNVTSTGGGGGGAATIADGADVAQGTTTDLSSASTVIGLLKNLKAALAGTLTTTTSWASAQHVVVDTAPTTAVTGTFWQATQPVSIASMPSTPVTGTFWQATQPVSGTFWQVTQPVSIAATVITDPSDRAARLLGVISAGTNRLGSVRLVDSADADQTTVKGTQTSRFLGTQDAKDSGRTTICLTIEFAFAQTAETLLTVTESRAGAATATFTSKVITSGKRIRFTGGFGIIETLGTGTTVPQRMYLRLRVNTAGATTASSPLQFVWGIGIPTGSAAIPIKSTGFEPVVLPDGVEYAGDGTATYGLKTPDWVTTTGTGRCKITLFAFEY